MRQRNCITLAGSCDSHDVSVTDLHFDGEKGCKNKSKVIKHDPFLVKN